MTFAKDIIISWDISENDLPTICITQVEYDPNAKHVIGTVINVTQGIKNGAISLNDLLAQHRIQKLIEEKQEGEE